MKPKIIEMACLTEAHFRDIERMYSDGATLTAIGTAVGISRERVRTVVKKQGLYRAPVATGHWDFSDPETIDQSSFWSNVSKGENDGCWKWEGAFFGETEGGAYGSFQVPIRNRTKSRGAHRVSWALANCRWPKTSEHVCHRCDNPACVNPAHLFLGSRTVNMQDMWTKGRNGGTAREYAERSHCKNGHPFSGRNLIERQKNGRTVRACRECARQRSFANNRRRRGPPKPEGGENAGA